ncbi:MAG: DUF2993 domain-containing protein [Actinomycetota bacterium]
MRRLLILLAVPVALLAAADYGVRLYSQSVVGDEVRSALGLSEKPSVHFGGWPFTPHLLSGDLPSATFTADTFAANGVQLRSVSVELDDVKFPSSRLITGGGGKIRAARGQGTAVLTGADITDALRRSGLPLTVTISDGRASVAAKGITVGLDVQLQGSALLLTPAAARIASARLPLPSIVQGLRFTSLKLDGSEAVVSFALRHVVFVVPS